MFDQAVVRTGVKFGVICALAGFAVILLLYFTGLNPYGQNSMWSWVFIPVAVFWGLSYFRKYYARHARRRRFCEADICRRFGCHCGSRIFPEIKTVSKTNEKL